MILYGEKIGRASWGRFWAFCASYGVLCPVTVSGPLRAFCALWGGVLLSLVVLSALGILRGGFGSFCGSFRETFGGSWSSAVIRSGLGDWRRVLSIVGRLPAAAGVVSGPGWISARVAVCCCRSDLVPLLLMLCGSASSGAVSAGLRLLAWPPGGCWLLLVISGRLSCFR